MSPHHRDKKGELEDWLLTAELPTCPESSAGSLARAALEGGWVSAGRGQAEGGRGPGGGQAHLPLDPQPPSDLPTRGGPGGSWGLLSWRF